MKKWMMLLVSIFLLSFGELARGRTFLVTNPADTIAPTSLRGAIIEANRRGGFNVIVLTHTNYPLTLQGAGEDAGMTGDLDITSGITVIIGSRSNVVIDARGLRDDPYRGAGDRAIHVLPNAILYLENVTVTGGSAATKNEYLDRNGENGGGINNAGLLLMNRCVVTNNLSGNGGPGLLGGQHAAGNGGGIYNEGSLIMTSSRVQNNSCGSVLGHGGGIFNAGSSILERCEISGNSGGGNAYQLALGDGSAGGSGGGIFNAGEIAVKQCVISANGAGKGRSGGLSGEYGVSSQPGGNSGNGGGICNDGILHLGFSTLAGNYCGNGGDGGPGLGDSFGNYGPGGVGGSGGSGAALYNTGEATINNCTISGNSCGTGGAGGASSLFPYPNGPAGSGGDGGGIFSNGKLVVNSSTISHNVAGKGGVGFGGFESYYATPFGTNFHHALGQSAGGYGGNGGGIFSGNAESSVVLCNTLVAKNSPGAAGDSGVAEPLDPLPHPPLVGPLGTNGTGHDLFGAFVSRGFNLIGIGEPSMGFTNGARADLVGTTNAPIYPLLGPLQDNGGFTPTHALLHGSPAIDKGRRFGLAIDQRGHHRPHDFASVPNAPGGDGTDIGAFELDVPFLSMKKLATCAVLSWDASCAGYTLEATTDLKLATGWTPVAGAPCIEGCEYQITNNVTVPYKFFRLRRN